MTTPEYPPTVCLDLDGVLANYLGWKDGELGEANPEAVKLAHMLRDADVKVIVFTCRTNRAFEGDHHAIEQNIIYWLEQQGLGFVELHTGYGKPFAGAYVDDRAVHFPKNEGNARVAFETAMRLLEEDPLAILEDAE